MISPHVDSKGKSHSGEEAWDIQKKVEISCEEMGFVSPLPLVFADRMDVPSLEEILIKGLSLEIGIPFPSQIPAVSPRSNGEQDLKNATFNVVRDTFDSQSMKMKTPNVNIPEAKNGLMDTLPWDQRLFSKKGWESGRELESSDETKWEEVISHSRSKKERKKRMDTSSGMITRTRSKADCGNNKLGQGRRSEKMAKGTWQPSGYCGWDPNDHPRDTSIPR